MMKLVLILLGLLVSGQIFAKECVGIKKCALEYATQTNSEVLFDKKVNFDNVSLLNETMTYEDISIAADFEKFLRDNFFAFNAIKLKKIEIISLREDKFNYAPIVLVTREEGIPPFINPQGDVTLVYDASKKFSDLSTRKIEKALKDVKKTEIENTNKILLSGAYEKVREVMELIVKEDIQ